MLFISMSGIIKNSLSLLYRLYYSVLKKEKNTLYVWELNKKFYESGLFLNVPSGKEYFLYYFFFFFFSMNIVESESRVLASILYINDFILNISDSWIIDERI